MSGPLSAPTNPGTTTLGTGLTAVAVQEDNSDVLEVRKVGGSLQVLLNQETLSFMEQSWLDLKGEGPAPSLALSVGNPSVTLPCIIVGRAQPAEHSRYP